MNTNAISCPGLDGSDPLTALASLGVLVTGERAGVIDRMWWAWSGAWRPMYDVRGDEDAVIDAVLEALAGTEVARMRDELESLDEQIAELERAIRAAGRVDRRSTPRDGGAFELAAHRKRLKSERVAASTRLDEAALAAVHARHPLTRVAQHLDDATKGGLSRADLRSLADAPGPAGYLSGVACDLELRGPKPVIARTHLSFANNNSGKQLIKDFSALARLATASRLRDALFGSARRRDAITGLGWDPASQRSYALQFRDPQKDVTCVAMHHALAFVGLACLTVVPFGTDRATLGVYAIPDESDRPYAPAESDDKEDDIDRSGPRVRRAEHLTWPISTEPLSPDAVRAALAWPELASPRPSVALCRAVGIETVMRSRRFALNKRSYLSPARPVA